MIRVKYNNILCDPAICHRFSLRLYDYLRTVGVNALAFLVMVNLRGISHRFKVIHVHQGVFDRVSPLDDFPIVQIVFRIP